MPPKQKYTKEEMIAAAVEIIRRNGRDGLTARGLGEELGSSSRPVFTIFQNMEEVYQETVDAVKGIYNRYIQEGLSKEAAFEGVGIQYIRFAREEPNLFKLLFMTGREVSPRLPDVLSAIDENSGRILEAVKEEYGMDEENSRRLYQCLWIFTHGIATLCANGVCRFTEPEIGGMLTDICEGMLIKLGGVRRRKDD
ncbi:TetR-like C-terminal domain-containing protein [Qiania dongpingensis]|uniref:TetR/AcrR family transcriptional regulator n=1 Tax=Qiania dongpingensis TaxID=2763669 RepID=A0A7G9G770_9FIRM|nr:TetR-like C-terminal domain-containing protein [Qiania dongpingensis]QNM06652.1 TetR/AcrR family transcriptional regulator [Qiania dongpingensis]